MERNPPLVGVVVHFAHSCAKGKNGLDISDSLGDRSKSREKCGLRSYICWGMQSMQYCVQGWLGGLDCIRPKKKNRDCPPDPILNRVLAWGNPGVPATYGVVGSDIPAEVLALGSALGSALRTINSP